MLVCIGHFHNVNINAILGVDWEQVSPNVAVYGDNGRYAKYSHGTQMNEYGPYSKIMDIKQVKCIKNKYLYKDILVLS